MARKPKPPTPEEIEDALNRAYEATFSTESGRKVLADMELRYCGSSFNPGFPDATAFNEGMRKVYIDIRYRLSQCEKQPEPQTAVTHEEKDDDLDLD